MLIDVGFAVTTAQSLILSHKKVILSHITKLARMLIDVGFAATTAQSLIIAVKLCS